MPSENNNPFIAPVKSLIAARGWSHYGLGGLTKPVSLELYDQWLKQSHHGDMSYLKNHRPLKSDLRHLAPKARSLIAIAVPYVDHPKPHEDFPVQQLKIGRYARGYDYHYWFQSQLQSLCDDLLKQFPDDEFLCFTDSKPILERDFAQQLGLGWVGKNSCLIHPKKGSLFLLGEIITSLDLGPPAHSPLPDMCGTCRRCIDACPTKAINDNRTLDARKCISYWTIESKTAPSPDLSSHFQSWFFGCDICQTVCPWNEKVFGKVTLEDPDPKDQQELVKELQWILESSNKKLLKSFAGTPLTRAGGNGLKRNALLVIENYRLGMMIDFLVKWKSENPMLAQVRDQVILSLSKNEQ